MQDYREGLIFNLDPFFWPPGSQPGLRKDCAIWADSEL